MQVSLHFRVYLAARTVLVESEFSERFVLLMQLWKDHELKPESN
jgi:hypothetical protein